MPKKQPYMDQRAKQLYDPATKRPLIETLMSQDGWGAPLNQRPKPKPVPHTFKPRKAFTEGPSTEELRVLNARKRPVVAPTAAEVNMGGAVLAGMPVSAVHAATGTAQARQEEARRQEREAEQKKAALATARGQPVPPPVEVLRRIDDPIPWVPPPARDIFGRVKPKNPPPLSSDMADGAVPPGYRMDPFCGKLVKIAPKPVVLDPPQCDAFGAVKESSSLTPRPKGNAVAAAAGKQSVVASNSTSGKLPPDATELGAAEHYDALLSAVNPLGTGLGGALPAPAGPRDIFGRPKPVAPAPKPAPAEPEAPLDCMGRPVRADVANHVRTKAPSIYDRGHLQGVSGDHMRLVPAAALPPPAAPGYIGEPAVVKVAAPPSTPASAPAAGGAKGGTSLRPGAASTTTASKALGAPTAGAASETATELAKPTGSHAAAVALELLPKSSIHRAIFKASGGWGVRGLRLLLRERDTEGAGYVKLPQLRNALAKFGVDATPDDLVLLRRVSDNGALKDGQVFIPTLMEALRGARFNAKRAAAVAGAFRAAAARARKPGAVGLTVGDVCDAFDPTGFPQFQPHVRSSTRDVVAKFAAVWGTPMGTSGVKPGTPVTEDSFAAFWKDLCPSYALDSEFAAMMQKCFPVPQHAQAAHHQGPGGGAGASVGAAYAAKPPASAGVAATAAAAKLRPASATAGGRVPPAQPVAAALGKAPVPTGRANSASRRRP